MNFLARIAFGVILLGLIVGLVVRIGFRRDRRQLLLMLSFLPWLLHLLYLLGVVLRRSALAPAAVLGFAAVALMLGVAVLIVVLGWRGRPMLLALAPLLLAALYLVGPVWWLSGALGRAGSGFDVIPTVIFAAATLFMGSFLSVYLFRAPKVKLRPGQWLRRR